MKKFLVSGLLVFILLVGFAIKTDATEQFCRSFPVYCGSSFAGYGYECGSTLQEFLDNKAIMEEVICQNF